MHTASTPQGLFLNIQKSCFFSFEASFLPSPFSQLLVDEVNGFGEKKSSLESAGRRLTELSRREDCDVIHNLIMTVQDRYKKLLQLISERGRMLEDVRKNAKQVPNEIPVGEGEPFIWE